jgi:hypothetical protein
MDIEPGAIRIMAALRLLSAGIEGLAAVYIFRLENVAEALRVNAALGLVGPAIFILVTLAGLVAIAERLSAARITLLGVAVLLIFAATRR